MNKNYNKKKRITISILSLFAMCLAACLIWYIGTMGKEELPVAEPEVPETEVLVTVPEIENEGTAKSEKEEEPQGTGETEETETEVKTETGELPTEESSEEVPMVPDTQPAHSDGNPRTPEEALPPSEPPVDAESSAAVENPDESGNCQPEHTPPQENQPQGGDTNPERAVYVPGFGYIENSGPNEQENSYTDGDWDKQIGTMQ